MGGGGEATLLERLAWRLLTRGGWSVDRRQFLSGSSFDLSLSALGRETDGAAIETAIGFGRPPATGRCGAAAR